MNHYGQELSQHDNIPLNESFRHFITCPTYLPLALACCQTWPLMQQPAPLPRPETPTPASCHAARWRSWCWLWWAEAHRDLPVAPEGFPPPDRPPYQRPVVLSEKFRNALWSFIERITLSYQYDIVLSVLFNPRGSAPAGISWLLCSSSRGGFGES